MRKIILAVATFVATAIFSLTAYIFLQDITVAELQEKFFKTFQYDYVYEYMGEADGVNSYFCLDHDATITTVSGLSIKCNILMEKEGGNYSLFYHDSLLSNEIIVTRNIALMNKLKEGDTLFVNSPVSQEKMMLSVKKVIPECFSYYSSTLKYDNGLIVIGYKSIFVDNLELPSFSFIEGENRPVGDYSLVKIYSTKEMGNEILSSHSLKGIYLFLILLFEMALCFSGVAVFSLSLLKHYNVIGQSFKRSLIFILENGVAELLLAFLISLMIIIIICVVFFSYVSFSVILVFLLEIALTILFSLLYFHIIKKRV